MARQILRRRQWMPWLIVALFLIAGVAFYQVVLTPRDKSVDTVSQADEVRPTALDQSSQGVALAAVESAPADLDVGAGVPLLQAQDDPAEDRERGNAVNPEVSRALRLFQEGNEAYDSERYIAAQHAYAQARGLGLGPASEQQLRNRLHELAERIFFSPVIIKGVPGVDRHRVRSGEYLQKLGKQYKVPHELLMAINKISDPRRLRAGQEIKVINGPFHAVVDRDSFELSIFLEHDGGQHFVCSFPVGLGEQGTPSGVWKVGGKLTNPTWYPPGGGKPVAADDPENPLGEYWIGLEGIKGEAVGAFGYGIHGTIETDSIGQANSLGCIRMRDPDIERVYQLLRPNHSLVTIHE